MYEICFWKWLMKWKIILPNLAGSTSRSHDLRMTNVTSSVSFPASGEEQCGTPKGRGKEYGASSAAPSPSPGAGSHSSVHDDYDASPSWPRPPSSPVSPRDAPHYTRSATPISLATDESGTRGFNILCCNINRLIQIPNTTKSVIFLLDCLLVPLSTVGRLTYSEYDITRHNIILLGLSLGTLGE